MITLSFLRWMLETGYTIGVDITHSWMGDKLFFWTGLAYANTFNELRIIPIEMRLIHSHRHDWNRKIVS